MNTNNKILSLRELMASNELDAYVIFTEDPHGSEYPADHWKFREYMSGFNGSAGTLVVTKNHAGLWVDSRYYIQAEKQLRGTCIEVHKMGMPGVPHFIDYLTYLLPSGARVGLNGFTISINDYRNMKRRLANFGIELDVNQDLTNDLYVGRPHMPTDAVWLMPKEFEGKTRQEKVATVRQLMKENNANHYIISALDDIAWLTNMRGHDVRYNPVFYAYMIITPTEEHLYIDPHKLTSADKEQLENDGIIISLYEHYERNLRNIPLGARIYYDPCRANTRNVMALPEETVKIEGPSLISHLKAKKTDFEIQHMEQAHIRDGVALVKFARWMMQTIGTTRVTELDLSHKLTSIREANSKLYIEDSFENIVAYDTNAAIVHYEPTIESNTVVEPQGMLLIDSGAQYVDGTTDITRTWALGPVSDKERLHYTLTLKGTIGLAMATFPVGTKGIQLDTFARQAMWRYGIDYGHGTGHGVGYCLNVHEGPQNISKRLIDEPIEVGMITSDEPGIYVEGSHGVRIENLTVCVEAKKTAFGIFLGFKTITMFPIDTTPIVKDLLTPTEIKWLNDYHSTVYASLSTYLDGEDLKWLEQACKPI